MRVRDDLIPDVAREDEGGTTGHRMEAAEETSDSELDEDGGPETDKAIRWLKAEWKPLVRFLRERDSDMVWEERYNGED